MTGRKRRKIKWLIQTVHWYLTRNSALTTPGRGRTPSTASRPTVWWGNARWRRWGISFFRLPDRQAATMASAWTAVLECMWRRKTAPGVPPPAPTTSGRSPSSARPIPQSRMPLRMWSTRRSLSSAWISASATARKSSSGWVIRIRHSVMSRSLMRWC